MELKCLLMILLEKNIIKKKLSKHYKEKLMIQEFSYKYDEVLKKIRNSNYDKENIIIDTGNHGHCFYILNKNTMKEFLTNEIIEEDKITGEFYNTTTFKSILSKSDLTYHFENDKDIKIERACCEKLLVTDLNKERKIKERKRKEKQEVLDFLNQLP